MSNSGPPQFPITHKLPGQTKHTSEGFAPRGLSRSGEESSKHSPTRSYVKITQLPKELQEIKHRTKLEGEIIRQNRDGSTRVRTQRGDIEVKPQEGKAEHYRAGQRVEIDIPPGRPPQEARVTVPASERLQQETPNSNTLRQSATPIQIEVKSADTGATAPETPTQTSAKNETAPPRTLEHLIQTQTPVRLEPLSTEKALQLTHLPLKMLVSTLSHTPNLKDQLISWQALNTTQPTSILPLTTPVPQTMTTTVLLTESLNVTLASQETIKNPALNFLRSKISKTTQSLAPEQKIPSDILLTNPIWNETTENLKNQKPHTPLSPIKINLLTNQTQTHLLQSSPPILEGATQSLTSQISTSQTTITDLATEKLKAKVTAIQLPTPQITSILQLKTHKTEISAPKTLEKTAIILQNNKAGDIKAQITGKTQQNLPILSITSPLTGESIFFTLHAPLDNILPGTQITLTPQSTVQQLLESLTNIAPQYSSTTMSGMTTALSPSALPLSFLTPGSWPLMEELQHSLSRATPGATQTFSALTPSPANPAQLGPAMLFFITAIRSGDLSQWLGEKNIETLKKGGKTGLLSRLSSESSTLSRLASEPISQDWRALTLPMAWENQIQKVALYYRHEKPDSDEEEDQKGARSTRFIFDLELDHIGAVQLDGLFRKKRLDLALRTQEPFSQNAQMDMRALYKSALEQADITGELNFQNKPEHWVTIQAEGHKFGAEA